MASAARVFNGCRSLCAAAKSATPKTTATAATTTTAAKKKSTVKKSAEKPAKKLKQPSTERIVKPVGILKPSPISPALGDFLGGVSESPRTEAVKKIWEYIKLHELQATNLDLLDQYSGTLPSSNPLFPLFCSEMWKFWLQNPTNKKEIICDEKLKTIFDGRDRVGFLEIAKLLAPHFVKTS
ncbi:SWIB domain-containing protein [Cynara cardunculus var. scolymus]|uniref:SWIB domain-containing protein n=1 Tax=Cynara cardunculus var. scolymus TaxID=59895 RepID=A0A103Y124_CYNCS|nr:SWIB domain-containing protein [Cynara cardunculus var. scolymus]